MNIAQEKVCHITAEPLFDYNAQCRQVFAILWKRVCWNQPAAIIEHRHGGGYPVAVAFIVFFYNDPDAPEQVGV